MTGVQTCALPIFWIDMSKEQFFSHNQGSATPAGWQCGCGEPDLLSQKFTKLSSSKFELTITLSANNSYLLLPVYGSWSAKYGGTGGNNSNNVTGDLFKPNGSDLKAPASTGSYKITVDFKTGAFTVQ